MVAYYTKLGLTLKHAKEVLRAIDEWVCTPTKKFGTSANEALRGGSNGILAQGLIAEAGVVQAYFKGRKSIRLYRGVVDKYAVNTLRAALQSSNRNKVKINVKLADSWTDSINIAKTFGGLIFSEDIPIEWIVSSYRTNATLNNKGEKEFIVSVPQGILTMNASNFVFGENTFTASAAPAPGL